MKAMILAAGQGKRMLPLTATTPKPLLRAGAYTLIEWQIRRLRKAGVRHMVINHNHLGEQIEQALGDGSALDVALTYSPETDWLETAGGIVQALPLLGDDFVVANADVWTEFPYQRLLERAASPAWRGNGTAGARPVAHVVLVPNAPHHPGGDFYLLPDGRVADQWAASTAGQEEPARLTYAGISLLNKALFAGVPPGPRRLAPLLREAMAASRVTGECYTGDWQDIGTPARLAALDRRLASSPAEHCPGAEQT